jgi:flagellar basal body-associated protein FliL
MADRKQAELQDDIVTEASEMTEGYKKPSKLVMIIGIVAGILILEGAGIFVAVKLFNNGPAEAVGIEIPDPNHEKHAIDSSEETVEMEIARLECPHTNTGRLYVIRMTVVANVPKNLTHAAQGDEGGGGGHGSKSAGKGNSTGIEAEIRGRLASIKDRMRTIVASADPGTLCLARSDKPDYGLSTLRRQFKTVLDDILGKGKVKDVLISDYMPTPID